MNEWHGITEIRRTDGDLEDEWQGFDSVATAIRDMVLDHVECSGFGDYGERAKAELVPLTDIVRTFKGSLTRDEIIKALDELQAAGKIALGFVASFDVSVKPKYRPRWIEAVR